MTSGIFVVDPEFIEEVSQIAAELCGFTDLPYCFGIGLDIQESQAALEYGLANAQQVALYAEVLASEKPAADPLDEVEKHDQLDTIAALLEKIGHALPGVENPALAKSMSNIASSLLGMIKNVAEEPMQKARKKLPMPKSTPKRAHLAYPVGTIKNDKIKVQPMDPQTTAPGDTRWNQARSGQVLSPQGTAVSSRTPKDI